MRAPVAEDLRKIVVQREQAPYATARHLAHHDDTPIGPRCGQREERALSRRRQSRCCHALASERTRAIRPQGIRLEHRLDRVPRLGRRIPALHERDELLGHPSDHRGGHRGLFRVAIPCRAPVRVVDPRLATQLAGGLRIGTRGEGRGSRGQLRAVHTDQPVLVERRDTEHDERQRHEAQRRDEQHVAGAALPHRL